jgi:hypothetical protein
VPVGGLAVEVFRRFPVGSCNGRRADLAALVVAAVFAAVLLLRPHEDTYTALDHSAYRLMTMAFAEGRGFHERDNLLKSLPPEDRNGVLLLPHMNERNTRDRSFLVRSLDTCGTEPFFYPLLPLSALGFDLIVPGAVSDYWVPFLALVFTLCLLWVGWAYGGWPGLALGVALLVGSPPPAWLFRGYYVESVGMVLIGLALLSWLTQPAGRALSWPACFALGLAVSLHPVLLVLALPLFVFAVIGSPGTFGHLAGSALFFAAGIAPLLLMTAFICQPYGSFGIQSLIFHYRISASHRITTIFGLAGLIVGGVLLAMRFRWKHWAEGHRRFGLILRWSLLTLLAVVPLCLAMLYWSERGLVSRGMLELWHGTRRAFGLVLLLSAVAVSVKGSWRARVALALTLATLPVFAYLKGAEQMEMWSQRRVLPVLVMCMVALLPAGAQALKPLASGAWRWRKWAVAAVCLLLLGLGTSNARRWPAPYLVRADRGAWEWTAAIRAEIGNRLVFFDYYPASVPMAADGRTRALSSGMDYPEKSLPGLMRWLRTQALTQDVWLVAAHRNPGIEDGVVLKELGHRAAVFDRVESKGCLPARYVPKEMDWTLTRVEPLASNAASPALHKIMDGGRLALRGRWVYFVIDIPTPSGRTVPAMWSQQGSGVIGPVPPPGQSVRFVLGAASGRKVPQTLFIQPPWTTNAVSVQVGTEYSETELVIPRQEEVAGQTPHPAGQGVYRIHAAVPYDPAEDGIRGPDHDLGALIHVIRIERQ